MAEDKTPSPPPRGRRSSFAGETFANLFGGHRGSMSRGSSDNTVSGNTNSQQPTQQYAGPITSAAAQAQRRRLSLTTLGLSGSPTNPSPFGSYPTRRESYGSSVNNDSIDESAIEDEFDSGPTPQTPFGRRLSFGAKALRDVRTGGGGGNTPPGQNGGQTSTSSSIGNTTTSTANPSLQKAPNGTISSRDAKGRGSSERFNWSENFRSRAERASSIAGGSGLPSGLGNNVASNGSSRASHGRAQSVATMEPPVREMPKPKEQVRPDHFQERILKGDFYMD
ncbi:uncharacterized protein RCC_04037 [Lecanosticta acicola]|uniref:Uncharacterized protein RCC_04037 n=1 Tax=Lecanosticta acicola TaxID=111012 RepID=A0AAI8YT54_9PEZI|nr:uncharacterized protein RCC_04037 [Lecanosticta acicola]